MECFVDIKLGLIVGHNVAAILGVSVGDCVTCDGAIVGSMVSSVVGPSVGCIVDIKLGLIVGHNVAAILGVSVGHCVTCDGAIVGSMVSGVVGLRLEITNIVEKGGICSNPFVVVIDDGVTDVSDAFAGTTDGATVGL